MELFHHNKSWNIFVLVSTYASMLQMSFVAV